MRRFHFAFLPVVCLVTGFVAVAARADVPRALPAGQQPADARLKPLRNLDGYFPFTPVESPQAWKTRADKLRRQVLVSQGLWPMPEKPALNAVIHGKVERDDYTVEKVFFESVPGHFVTGNLYRPKGDSAGQKRPGVLCPHGHWANGRFQDHGEPGVRREIAQGGERFERGGRHILQARAVGLARLGCVVFLYDMEGYADSVQIPHRPGFRPHMNTKQDWGFFSPQAELRLQNMMGLQTWNSVRALDFLLSLPDVDPARIGMTGESGGGTQTMLLTAIDDRVGVSVPAVMVSTAMQGGCTCENAPYLRVNAGNIDIAALAAPRPLAMLAADDWTKELMTKGFPDLKALYKQLGHEDRVAAFPFLHFGHNYNAVSRMAMYGFVNKHLNLGQKPQPIIERDYEPLTPELASVWDAQHPKPSGENVGEAHERALVRLITDALAEQIDQFIPRDKVGLEEYRRVVGGAWDVLIGRRIRDVGKVEFELKDKTDRGPYLVMTGLLNHTPKAGMPTGEERREQLPMLFLHPKEKWNGQVVIWVDDKGKSEALLAPDGSPKPHAAKLLEGGFSVLGVDLIGQGEFLKEGQGALEKQRLSGYGEGKEAWQQAAAYTFGYNPPLFAQRVHDILTVIHFVQGDEHNAKKVHLVGLGATAGPLVAAARAQSGGEVDTAAVDTAGFRFESLDRLDHPMFVPGAVKYHDVPGLLALSAPRPLWVAGEGDNGPRVTKAVYEAAGVTGRLEVFKGDNSDAPMRAVEWLMK